MLSMLQEGGMMMYAILGISIAGFVLFCERATFLFLHLKLDTDGFLQKIVFFLEKMNYRGALEECTRAEKHPLGRILKAGLLKSGKKDKDIEQAIKEKMLSEIPPMKARINYMIMLACLAVLFGLFGTTAGLISVFRSAGALSEVTSHGIIMKGAADAMLTAAFGFIIAIPCLIGYFILAYRGTHLIEQFEEKALSLFNILSSLNRDKELLCQSVEQQAIKQEGVLR
ncbi:MAG: MotA/TolQ/ExbB proton channel family protein [bacterium]